MSSLSKLIFSVLVIASSTSGSLAQAAAPAPAEMNVPSSITKLLKSFEPSGMIYLADLDRYLFSSDDTDKKETPFVFLMDKNGNVEKTPILIHGLSAMTDIESISMDRAGDIYFLSSLGINKSGKDKFTRNLFVKAERQGRIIEAVASIELRSLLLEAIQASNIPELVVIKRKLVADLDVESSLVVDGKLLVGLKNPQPQPGHALILNLGLVEDLFTSGEIASLSIWRTIDFSKVSRNENVLSDILLTGETLFLSTTSEAGNGALWKLNLPTNELKQLQTFQGFKPEGLSYNAAAQELMVVFDQGDKPARFQLYSSPR